RQGRPPRTSACDPRARRTSRPAPAAARAVMGSALAAGTWTTLTCALPRVASRPSPLDPFDEGPQRERHDRRAGARRAGALPPRARPTILANLAHLGAAALRRGDVARGGGVL